jgi:hypothetical protein
VKVIVLLVSVHSFAIGLTLLLIGGETFAPFGWKPDCEQFLFHQVGIFHVVLSLLYIIEYLRYKRVNSILLAKGAAFVFLMIEYFFLTREFPLLISGLTDGCIGVVVGLCAMTTARKVTRTTP